MDEMMDTSETNRADLQMGDQPAQTPQVNPDDPVQLQNLVPIYEANDEQSAWLTKFCTTLCKQIEGDDEGRQPWIDRRANQIKLYAGAIAPLKYPAEGMKAPHDAVLCRVILQSWTRGWDSICPAKGPLIQVHSNGHEDEDIASRREEYMNWQLRHRVPNWIQGHAESFLQFLLSGSVFREHYWDPVRKTTCFDHLTADDVIVPYTSKDLDPLMRDVPRITRVLHMFRWTLEKWQDQGSFVNVDKLYEKGGDSTQRPEKSSIQEVAEEIDGVKRPESISITDDKDIAQRDVFRCHTWAKLPDQERMKPVTVVMDRSRKIPLSLTIREDDDPFDRMRFDAETKQYQITSQNMVNQFKQQVQQHQQTGGMDPMTGQPLPPPQQPQLPQQPEPCRQEPVYNMLHYRLFPNPQGFYGIGIGYLLENANELINELEAEYLLAAKLANMQQGLLPEGASTGPRGEIRAEMGKFIKTALEPEQMAGIKVFQFPGPSEGMWKFIQKHKEDSYALIADADTLSGEAGPTNETKAAAQQRNFNATQLVSVVVRRYTDPMSLEPKMLAKDNGLFMDDTEFYRVTEPNHEARQGEQPRQKKEAYRTDYLDEFDLTFTADQRLQTQPERIQTATNLINQLMNSPYAKDPQMGPILFSMGFAQLFRALDLPEFVKALGPTPPPPQPPAPPTPMDQIDENAGFFNGKDHPVLPDDDDEDHLVKMDDLKKSDHYTQMPATGKQLFDRHEAAHTAQHYQKLAKGQPTNGAAQPGGAPGMAGGPPHPGGPGPAPVGPRPPAQPPAQPV